MVKLICAILLISVADVGADDSDAADPAVGAAGNPNFPPASVAVGWGYYKPKLESIRDKVGDFTDDAGIYAALHLQPEDNKGVMIGLSKYDGHGKGFKMNVSNITTDYTVVMNGDDSRLALWFSAGANLLYMERYGIPGSYDGDAEYADWLWGLNGLAGIGFRIVGPLYIGYEIGYIWSKQSTLGGTMYDLSCFSKSATINMMF